MRSYTVLAPPLSLSDGAPAPLALVFVKDGFCWPALVVPLPWMLFRGLFIEAAAYVVVAGSLAAFSGRAGMAATLVLLAVALALGVLGNDIRRFALARRGYRLVGSASGRSIEEAEIRYFMLQPDEIGASPTVQPARVAAPGAPAVLGLFPSAENGR